MPDQLEVSRLRVRNRTDRVLTWVTCAAPESLTSTNMITWEKISPDQPMDERQGEKEVYLYVSAGEVRDRDLVRLENKKLIWHGGPYLNTHEFLLVNGGRTVVDWTVVGRKYLSGAASLSEAGDGAEAALARGLAAASTVLSALSTGLTTIGPMGALPSGLFSLVASMLVAEEAPPPPPNLIEIEKVVERVVERVVAEQLQRDSARKAASKFLRAQSWLLAQDRQFRAGVKEKGGPRMVRGKGADDVARHFAEELEGWAAPSGDFQGHIDLIRGQPEIAKWMIPAFMAGIAAYLQIWRLHALLTKSISADTISAFQAEVNMCREALIATSQAWNGYCDTILRQESIEGIPEGFSVKKTLTRAHTGTDDIGPVDRAIRMPAEHDPTPVGKAVWSLELAYNMLAEDLAAMSGGKQPKRFCKESWIQEERTAP